MSLSRRLAFLLSVVLLAAGPVPASGQPQVPTPEVVVAPADVTQELRLRDGTTALGRVEAVDGTQVTFRTLAGATLTLQRGDIASLTTAAGRAAGAEFWKDDPNPTRLFFGPTGRPLKRGDVYLGVYEIVIPFVQVGITDRLSIGGGTPLVFFGDGDGRPFWLTPKFTVVSRPRTQVSVGAMHMMNIDGDNLGIAYGALTQGSRDTAVTLGVGYGYVRGEDTGAPVVMLGGEHRVHRHIKLVTENYAFEGGGITSAGVRFISGRLSADLGLAMPLGVDDFFIFPLVNFVWTFQ
jgi:hypothetical protein